MVNLLANGLLLLQVLPVLVAGWGGHHHDGPRYKDPHAPVEVRVEDLLHRMTIEDKAAQLVQGVFLFLIYFPCVIFIA